jgi:hypothetical protein
MDKKQKPTKQQIADIAKNYEVEIVDDSIFNRKNWEKGDKKQTVKPKYGVPPKPNRK